ncbi:hypothetical protein ABW20_dc0104885 [Dactylellina cionopaga]|nr:hypothetical protein ABW20_dc0104885 [Dactylellina cionopaga]
MRQDSSSSESKLPYHVGIAGLSDDSLDIPQAEKLKAHLPATFRTKRDHISIPTYDDSEFLQRELLVKRLDDIQDHLWLVGRPMPPRPLHYQVVLARNIIITESMELHLVWSGDRIFVKPIPSYLLDMDFWTNYLDSYDDMDMGKRQTREELSKSARGFLFTYTALIAHESDFRIAKDSGLLPLAVTWEQWRDFTPTERLATNVPFQDVSYGIAVLAMIAPLIIGVAIIGIVLFIVVYNWLVTKTYEKRRFREMGLLPEWGDRDAEGGH